MKAGNPVHPSGDTKHFTTFGALHASHQPLRAVFPPQPSFAIDLGGRLDHAEAIRMPGVGTKQQTYEPVKPIDTFWEQQITPGRVPSNFEQICSQGTLSSGAAASSARQVARTRKEYNIFIIEDLTLDDTPLT